MEIKKIASIDVGSNAIRLLINTIYVGKDYPTYNKTSLIRVPIRLGRDVFLEGKISGYNIHRLIDTMKAFKLLMNVHEVEHFRACATSAMREAKNGQEVIDIIKEKSELDLEIINGKEEAGILLDTELQSIINPDENYIFVDVGGGSTEISFLRKGKIDFSKSFKVGSVRLMENKVDVIEYKESMKNWVKKNIKKEDFSIIGSGGNINFAFKHSGNSIGVPLTYEYLKELKAKLEEMTLEERLEKLNIRLDRADVVTYALDIYCNIMKWSGSKYIHVPKIGLADGIIQNLYHKHVTKK